MCKRVQAKKGKNLTTPEMLEDFKKKPKQSKQKKKIYQRIVIKIQVNVMNAKDREEQEDMGISEKEDDTACNIYHTVRCGKHTQRRTRGLYLTHVT